MQNLEYRHAKLLRAGNRSGSKFISIFLCALVLVLPAMAAAADGISGTIINKTTGKPAVADEILLINISADMKEAGRTRADSSGNFQFHVAGAGVPWLIKVTHAGVRYESVISAQDRPVEIGVFDKTDATTDVKSGIQVIQLETDAGYLRATEMFTLINTSNPPRTIQKEGLFSIPLPPGAVLLSSLAEGPGESVVKSIAVAPPKETRCYFNFPLRPGTTKIQLQYQLPYSGSFTLAPYIPFPADMFGITMPASMQFQPSELGAYTRQSDGDAGVVELIRNAHDGSAPPFTVSGAGPALTEGGDTSAMLQYNANSRKEPPVIAAAGNHTADLGRNLGPSQLLWPMFFVVIVVASSMVLFYRRQKKLQAVNCSADASAPDEAIREQLFSLEVDRLQNRISKSRYATARSLLEKKLVAELARAARP